ncbi:MAG: hypothetical protein II332_03740 [Kiritimatiellae bacterium]|nr:hypothetical protein [Kiritimatiellia bacterium]
MKTKIFSFILALFMLIGVMPTTPVFALAADNDASKIVNYDEDFSLNELDETDVVYIDYSDINRISSSAKEIVDAGATIFILYPEVSAEAIAEMLSIPKGSTTLYQSQPLMAYSIYKLGDHYVFANHYIVLADTSEAATKNSTVLPEVAGESMAPMVSSDGNVSSNFSDVITASEYYELPNALQVNPEDFVSTAISAKADVVATAQEINTQITVGAESTAQPRSTTLPSITATESWNDTLNVYDANNTYYGYLNCTVYGYAKGNGMVNGALNKIYDVVSVVKAYPASNVKVKRYEVEINANYTDFSNLQTTTLLSGVTRDQGLSLSGSYSQSDGGGGSGTYTTNWTYNPESQTITESSSAPRIVKWKAEPTSPRAGKAFDIAPGMRVACPTQYMRGAFINVYCNALFLGITLNTNSINVGGWF